MGVSFECDEMFASRRPHLLGTCPPCFTYSYLLLLILNVNPVSRNSFSEGSTALAGVTAGPPGGDGAKPVAQAPASGVRCVPQWRHAV